MNLLKLKYLIFGYVKISNVFNSKDLNIYDFKDQLLNQKNFIRGVDFLKEKRLINLFFKEKLIEVNKKIFGNDFLYSPGFVAQHNHYGENYLNKKKYSVFHIDSDFEWENNERYLNDYNHKLAKIGFYTQSYKLNCNILILPFLHHIFKSKYKIIKYSIGNRLINLLRYLSSFNLFSRLMRPAIEAGDVVIFDCMLPHGSDLGSIDFKFTIYNEIGSKTSMINFFKNNIIKRAYLTDQDESFERDKGRYKDQYNLIMNDYPKKIVKEFSNFIISKNHI